MSYRDSFKSDYELRREREREDRHWCDSNVHRRWAAEDRVREIDYELRQREERRREEEEAEARRQRRAAADRREQREREEREYCERMEEERRNREEAEALELDAMREMNDEREIDSEYES